MYARTHSRFPIHAVTAEKNSVSIQTLAEELEDVATKWFEVGLQLRLRPDPLDAMRYSPGQDTPATKLRKILLYWMKEGKNDDRTWGALAKAVERCRNVALADRIRRRKDYEKGSMGKFSFNFRESSMIRFMT